MLYSGPGGVVWLTLVASGMDLAILASTVGGGWGRQTGGRRTKAGSGQQSKQEVKSSHRKEHGLSKPLPPASSWIVSNCVSYVFLGILHDGDILNFKKINKKISI